MESRPRFLVVGCGGIGGIVTASLSYQELDVTALTRNELIADAVHADGIRTQGELSLGTVRVKITTSLEEGDGRFDYVLMCTQPPQVEEAARQVMPYLAEHGQAVVFQNGLCELRVAEIFGRERVVGGIIAWGASMLRPGHYDRTSAGGFTLGRLDGAPDDRTRALANSLEAIGPVTLTDNLLGARWSKLAINCAISSLGTVAGDRLGVLMRKRWVRRLALEVMTETVAVARAEGVALQKVSGTLDLDWLALTDDERGAKLGSAGLVAKHGLLLAVGTRYRRLRSSMLNAIERGRPPAVDFLNGEVVDRGAAHGIATPINAALRAAVWSIARDESSPSLATLRALYDATRTPASTTASDSAAPNSAAPVSAAPPSPDTPSSAAAVTAEPVIVEALTAAVATDPGAQLSPADVEPASTLEDAPPEAVDAPAAPPAPDQTDQV